MTLPAFWLIVMLCFDPGHCVPRLYPEPIPTYEGCLYLGASLIRARVVDQIMCQRKRPAGMLTLPATINPERFA